MGALGAITALGAQTRRPHSATGLPFACLCALSLSLSHPFSFSCGRAPLVYPDNHDSLQPWHGAAHCGLKHHGKHDFSEQGRIGSPTLHRVKLTLQTLGCATVGDSEEMRIETRGQRVAVWIVAAAMFVVLMIVTPRIPQDQKYHQFADKRNFYGIPNTLNVVSNFPFLVVGIVGLVLTLHGNNFGLSLKGEVLGWSIFFVGITATAFGSAYYHLKPNDARLVWDRLPMTVSFASVMAVFVIERIDETTGRASIFPLLIAGAGSVAYWRFANDLRIYALVQFVPCFAIPAMAILLPPKYSHSHYWLWAAGWYLLAKVQEALDMKFYRWTHFLVSGHTLKHLSAAMVPVMTIIMLYNRNVRIERQSLLDKWRQQVKGTGSSPRGNGDSFAQKWKLYWSGRSSSSSLLHDESESLVRA